jgi:putative ABC transport system ATP-binding protein
MRLDNVSRTFDDGAVVALVDLNLSIEASECVAILGKSGSGKSTLIHLMSGCDHATSGDVCWRGQPVRGQSRWRALRAKEIGTVFQEFHLMPALTAVENVELALMGKGISATQRKRRSIELLTRVGLGARLHHLPKTLSGGERQRVAIARSIANEPALLLADEPTGSLDSINAVAIMELLLDLQRTAGMTLVMATHDHGLAAQCLRRITIKDGRIIEDVRRPDAAESPAANTARVLP